MAIYLGNLKTEEILSRLGVELEEAKFKELDAMRTDNATVTAGKRHGFDLPFQITCGDKGTFEKVIEILKPYASDFKTKIQIAHK